MCKLLGSVGRVSTKRKVKGIQFADTYTVGAQTVYMFLTLASFSVHPYKASVNSVSDFCEMLHVWEHTKPLAGYFLLLSFPENPSIMHMGDKKLGLGLTCLGRSYFLSLKDSFKFGSQLLITQSTT